MSAELLEVLPNVVAALIIVGCIASIFGFRFGRPSTPRPSGPVMRPRARGLTARPVAGAEAESRPDRPDFRRSAEDRLAPLLKAVVDRAHAHGFEARFEVTGEARAASYRLEVKRPDHPEGQPLPYITFSEGDAGLVDIVYGGMFPGPIDHNGHDTEIGWRTVRWDQVDNVLTTFAHKVFARFD